MGLQPLNKVIDYGRMHCFFPFYYLSRIVQFTCWQGRMCTLRILVVHISYFWFNSNTEAAPRSCCKTCSPRTNSLLAKLVKRSRERRPTWMPYPIITILPPPHKSQPPHRLALGHHALRKVEPYRRGHQLRFPLVFPGLCLSFGGCDRTTVWYLDGLPVQDRRSWGGHSHG